MEYIDSRFLKHHFGEKNGVLFKEKWPAISQESTHADYFLDGVRNKKSSTTAKDVKPTLKFSQKLWDAETTEDVGHLLRKYWNLDSILNTLVVAMVIGEPLQPHFCFSFVWAGLLTAPPLLKTTGTASSLSFPRIPTGRTPRRQSRWPLLASRKQGSTTTFTFTRMKKAC